jgi:hypothetical protein
VQGQICDILRPQLAMNCFLALWPYRFPHFGYIILGGGGVGGSDIRSMSSIRPICKCRCPPLPPTPHPPPQVANTHTQAKPLSLQREEMARERGEELYVTVCILLSGEKAQGADFPSLTLPLGAVKADKNHLEK